MTEISTGLSNAFAIFFGLVVGSFLNVVVARLPIGENIAWPGSRCPGCKTSLRWWENIPVASYLALGGKCRTCKKQISVRYPVIELLTALLFLAAKLRFGLSFELVVRDFPFIAILIAVTFIDLEHRLIPDPLSLGGLVLGLFTAVIFSVFPDWGTGSSLGVLGSFSGAALGFGFFYGLAWTYYRLTGRSGLGGGDIKLLAMLGAFLGVSGVFSTILISSVFGSVVGISWALIQKRRNPSPSDESLMQLAIPYGPFLVVGGLYHYFLGDTLWLRFMTPM